MKLVKHVVTPVAAAVALALASAGAQAQSTLPSPSVGAATPSADSLFVAVQATTTGDNESEVVNLGYLFSQINNPADANSLTPDVAGGAFAPATVAGQNVLQLNFGVLPSFSTLFTAGTDPTYSVFSNGAGDVPAGIALTTNSPSTLTSAGPTAYTSLQTAIQSEVASWQTIGGGVVGDATCGTTICVQNATNLIGFTSVGTADALYDFTKPSRTTVAVTPYANATGDGFFYLSSSGDLSYNVPTTVSAVPLPAAVWLFASGLAGLGAIGRRRRTAV
jgi:hypothetical protein